jgi:unsaturated rhamnogalacturonyl hydrolase
MNHRSTGVFAILTLSAGLAAASPQAASIHYDALAGTTAEIPMPANKRAPFGWPVFALDRSPVLLTATGASGEGDLFLRLTVAVDDRELRRIEVRVAGSGEAVGQLDVRFAYPLQTFQLAVPAQFRDGVKTRGMSLHQIGHVKPLWLFAAAPTGATPIEFQPHLFTVSGQVDRIAALHQRLVSVASVQPFGWIEGCVLEGLQANLARDQPAVTAARAAHWRLFSPSPGQLRYENHNSEPFDGRIHTIEGGLPFADLVRHDPGNPLVNAFLAFTVEFTQPGGAIQDPAAPSALTAEGSYTIAYPLALIAVARRDPGLAAIAHRQLVLRRDRLWHEGAIWLRHYQGNDTRTFRGWSRGIAWYALGLVRTIEVLRPQRDVSELEAELRRVAAWVLPLQRPDGLWPCFLEEAQVSPDTSGSSGIATALAAGARLGILSPSARDAARRTLAASIPHITPDGLLDGVAQSNRGGEALQRGDYRVLSLFGSGLLAQLVAECAAVPPPPTTTAP